MLTPWGKSTHQKKVSEGITYYGTESHGGLKLSAEKLAQMPLAYRLEKGWYEEDCEVYMVFYCFPDFFTTEQINKAESKIINYFPDEYETFTGKIIPPGGSCVKDQFFAETAKNNEICDCELIVAQQIRSISNNCDIVADLLEEMYPDAKLVLKTAILELRAKKAIS